MQEPITIDNFLNEKECEFLHSFIVGHHNLQSELYPDNYVPWPLLYNLFETKIKDIVLPKLNQLPVPGI